MIWLVVAAIFLASYLLGSIPSGLLISKSRGIDIREHGSKNIGATNVWRVMGKRYGIFAFVCDTAKGWLAVTLGVWIARHFSTTEHLLHGKTALHFLPPDFAGITAALGCILGHNFPVWLRFKGGKGVATSLGVIIGMMPLAALIDFVIWGAVFKVSRYVSLASLVAAACLPVVVIGLLFLGGIEGWANFYFAVAAAALVIKRHTPNIQRLRTGTELRFGDPKPAPPSSPTHGPN